VDEAIKIKDSPITVPNNFIMFFIFSHSGGGATASS
jgi:hypothetical protein